MSEQKRGQLTERVLLRSEELFGYKITQKELRMMPYMQYSVMNSQNIDPAKVDPEEREILSRWREEGKIEGGASGLKVSKDFWDKLNEIMWLAYVDLS